MLKTANVVAIVGALAMLYSAVALWGGRVTGALFPVVTPAIVTEVEPVDRRDRRGTLRRDYAIYLDFSKGRPCDFLKVRFIRADGTPIGTSFLGPQKGSRPVAAWEDVGPWRLYDTDVQTLVTMRIEAQHRCGGPWWSVSWLKWWRWPWVTYTDMTPEW